MVSLSQPTETTSTLSTDAEPFTVNATDLSVNQFDPLSIILPNSQKEDSLPSGPIWLRDNQGISYSGQIPLPAQSLFLEIHLKQIRGVGDHIRTLGIMSKPASKVDAREFMNQLLLKAKQVELKPTEPPKLKNRFTKRPGNMQNWNGFQTQTRFSPYQK